MEREYVLEIANTIKDQIKCTVGVMVMFSWGIERMRATIKDDMAALRFHVNGMLFKGDVTVAYNEGGDYYMVYLGDELVGREVYCDEIGTFIDRKIESGDNKEEYKQKIQKMYE
jgi:hypothetical protein